MAMPSRAEDLFRQIREMTTAEQTTFVENWVHQGQGQMETEYLDFKNSARSFQNPNAGNPDDKDAETWSKAIASFANTEGGLIVWGIDARAVAGPNPGDIAIDRAVDLRPLADTTRHVQLLKNKLRDSTNEPIPGIDHLEVAASNGNGGYVISFVPEGPNKPYRAERLPGKPYIQRIGDGTELIPHGMLRSLFHPRTHPVLRVYVRLDETANTFTNFNASVENVGTATASEIVMRLSTNKRFDDFLASEPFRLRGAARNVTETRLVCQESLHPGDRANAFTAMVNINGRPINLVQQSLWGLVLKISIYSKDHDAQHFSHTFSADDYQWEELIELDRIDANA